MAQEDGAIRIVTKITTKDAEESLDSLEYQIKKSAKYMDTLRQKMDALKGQKIPTREYKDLQAELARAEKELQKLVAQQEDWGKIGITSGGAWDTLSEEIEKADYKIDDIKAKMQSLTDAGKDFTLGEETFEYKGYERQLKYEEEAIVKAGEHYKKLASDEDKLSEIKKNSTVVDQKMIDLLEQRNRLAEKLKELEKAGVAEGYEEHNQAYIEWKNAADAVKAYRAELDKQTDSGQAKIAQQEAKAAEKREAAQRRAEEQAERALQRENERIQRQAENEAKLAAKEAERQTKIQAEAAEEQRLDQIRVNATVSNQEIVDLLERRRQLISEIKDMEAAGVGLGYQQYEDANRELEEVNGKIKEYRKNLGSVPEKFNKMRKSANKAFTAVAQGTKKSSGLLSNFTSRLKGIALSLLIFNWISKGFNAMISGMKKGFENFAGYSDSYAQNIQNMKNAMSTLGNQFAAAFAPIVQMVIPWLTQLVSAISTAMTYVAQFIAVLSGKSTFTKAKKVQDDYNKSLGGTAKAADKARGALAKFDDLDVLEKPSDASGGGAALGNVGADMFEEVPIDKEFSKLAEMVEGLLDRIKKIIHDFSIGDFFQAGKDVSALAIDIFNLFSDAIDKVDWYSIGNKVGDFLAGVDWFGVIKSAFDLKFNIWKAIAEAWFGMFSAAPLETSVITAIGTLKWKGLGEAFSKGLKGIEIIPFFTELFSAMNPGMIGELGIQLERLIEGTIFDPFTWEGLPGEVFNAINDALWEITYFIGDIMNAMGAELIKFGSAVFNFDETIPWMDAALEWFSKISEDFNNQDWLGIGRDILLGILNGFVAALAGILEVVKDFFIYLWDSLCSVFDMHSPSKEMEALGENIMAGILVGIESLIGNVWVAIESLWDGIKRTFERFYIWIKGVFVTDWSQTFGFLGSILNDFFDVVGGIWDSIKQIFGGVIDFVVGVFTGDWEKAWNGIVDVFKGIFNLIPTIIEGILNLAIDLINGLVDGINVVTGVVGIPEIPDIPKVKLPRLATGAVIRGGNPFMAILGDQPAGQTNIEAPLDTIRQAVREELAGMNLGNAGSGQTRVVLNINGIDVGEAMLDDLFSVMSRRGYDVSVLGVT